LPNKTILVADDSATMRKILEKTFAAEPYDVVSVPSGEAAIVKARELRPDAILVDIGMPGVNGYDVCKTLRAEPAFAQTPILLLFGASLPYDEARGRDSGATEGLKKPFDTQQLIDKLGQLTAQGASRPITGQIPVAPIAPVRPVTGQIPVHPVQPRPPVPASPAPSPGAPLPLVNRAPGAPLPPARPPVKETIEFGRPSAVPLQPPAPRPAVPIAPVRPSFATTASLPAAVTAPQPVLPPPAAKPAMPAPIELDTSATADEGMDAFHVGTLAELANLDHRARPLSSAPAPDAIELDNRAASVPLELDPAAGAVPPRPVEPSPATRASSELADKVAAVVGGGLSAAQVEAIAALSRDVIERVVWEVVPDLAETIIREELAKLTAD